MARRIKRLRPGEVLYFKGDPGTEMYVVVSGCIRQIDAKSVRPPLVGDVEFGTGEFFGESCFVGQSTRERTAVAVGPSVLLCIDKGDLNELVRDQPALAARILKGLDRGGDSGRESEADDPELFRLRDFDVGSKLLFLRSAGCPVCEARFQVETVRESRLAVEARLPDFRVKYREIEPLWYRYIVCPRCLFAGKKGDFDAPPAGAKLAKLQEDAEARLARFGVFDFQSRRDASLAIVSMQLAEHCYNVQGKPSLDRATVALNLMWMYEDAGSRQDAHKALKDATRLFIESYHNDRGDRGPKADQRLAYLIGWLSHRQYQTNQAMSFIAHAARLEQKGDRAVAGMVRALIPDLRKRKAEQKEIDSRIEAGGDQTS